MQRKSRFDVSDRMHVYAGVGFVPTCPMADGIVLSFGVGRGDHRGVVAISNDVDRDSGDDDLVFHVDPQGCREVLGVVPTEFGIWHLSPHQREIVSSVVDCALTGPARRTLRIVKSVELLCSVVTELESGRLVPADEGGALSETETRRVVEAMNLVTERCHEPLTVDIIAGACGTNRDTLSRGFRALFHCSIGDALARTRLEKAHKMLLVTDLPVSAVGYRCGYRNNASFARAFSRRFGLAPTRLRAGGVGT